MASFSSTSKLPSEPLPWRPNSRPKLPPGALLDIADDLLWDLFTVWLPLEAVCRLDSALCQKRRRPYYLALLAKKVLLFNREEIRVLTVVDPYKDKQILYTHRALGAAALNWVLKRGIHLASLQLPDWTVVWKKSDAEWQGICAAVASLALDGRLDKLETISVNRCLYISNAVFVAILSKCYRSVKSIDSEGCDIIDENVVVHIKRCTKLEAFTANGRESGWENETVAEFMELFQSCRKLRKVDLNAFYAKLTDEVVLSVADNCHILEHLCLRGCSAVSDSAFRRVAESCPLLQFVDLVDTQITDATVVALCNRSPFLKQLFLGACVNLSDAAVLAVAERLPGLTHIDLWGINATSSALETLTSKCHNLEYINLGHANISDVTLSNIAEYCSKLEVLDVYFTAVTAVGLIEIATKCSKLKTVMVDNNKLRATMKQMCPNIEWVEC